MSRYVNEYARDFLPAPIFSGILSAEEIEELDRIQERFLCALDRGENFLVTQPRRRDQRNVAGDRGEALQLAKLPRRRRPLRKSLGKSISATKTGALPVGLRGNQLPGNALPLLTKENFRGQGELRALQTTQCHFAQTGRLQRSFEIMEIELPGTTAAPLHPTVGLAAEEQTKPANFLAVRRTKNPSDLKKPHAFRTCANVSLKRRHQTGNQTRPQRDMIFTQRIAQLDRFPDKTRT